jgi:hypothetical protein
MLSVLLVVLVAAYALILLFLVFVADVNNADSLRGTAAFFLMVATVTFGALMFFGSGTMSDTEEEEEDIAVSVPTPPMPLPAATAASSPAVCATCGQENPSGANFCFSCGAGFDEAPEDEAMPDQPAMTKADVLQKLREGGEDALKRLRATPAEAFEAGRYENGWNGRQILAHVASIEWTYPRILDLARAAPAPAEAAATPDQPSVSDPRNAGTPQIVSYNERQVEKRADSTVAELLAEFETNRAVTIEAVQAADESLFGVTITSSGGAHGPLAAVLNLVAVLHVAQHVENITGPRM